MKYLKLFVFLSFFIVGLFAQAKLAYAGASLSLSPGTKSVLPDSDFEVDILLDTDGEETDAVDVIILYDQTKLLATDVALRPLYDKKISEDVTQLGIIIVQAKSGIGSSFTGAGTLATITFEAKEEGLAHASFKMDAGSTLETNVMAGDKDILTSISNGSYDIYGGIGGEGDATVSASPTASATPSAVPETGFFEPTILALGLGALLVVLALSFFVFL